MIELTVELDRYLRIRAARLPADRTGIGELRLPRTRLGERGALPSEFGPIHFVGIGGIGMSGIAEVLLNIGYKVQGSDASDNANVKRLRERGTSVFVGHDAAQVGEAGVVVVSCVAVDPTFDAIATASR